MLTFIVAVRPRLWLWPVAAALLLPALCLAFDVRVVGVTPGQSAEIVIEGGAPLKLEVGETVEGVTLLTAGRTGAVVRVHGNTRTLPLVAEPSAAASARDAESLTLAANGGGQFVTKGAVNGRAMRFVVDTGATLTTLSRADARRIGLDYRGGTPARAVTVNGIVNGWRVSLDSVRVGDITERDVDAMVVDNDQLPVGLLGMSFLSRFETRQQGSTFVLRRRR